MIPLQYGPAFMAQLGTVILGVTLLGAAAGMGRHLLKNGKRSIGPPPSSLGWVCRAGDCRHSLPGVIRFRSGKKLGARSATCLNG